MKNALFALMAWALLLNVGCSTDSQLERKLTRKDGLWTIKHIEWQRVISSITQQDIRNGSENNAGTLRFSKDGNLEFNYRIDTFNRQGLAYWSEKDGDLTIVYQDLAGANRGSLSVPYSVQNDGINKLTLQGAEIWQDSIGQTVTFSTSLELER